MRLETLGVLCKPRSPSARRRGRKRDGLGLFGAALAVSAFAGVLTGSFERFTMDQASTVGVQTAQADIGPVWTIDADQDGVTDFANPTQSYIRAEDCYGSGAFGAGRDGGKREHAGVDYVAAPGALVRAPISGTISKLGYAYAKNTALRYIEVINERAQLVARVLYVDPAVAVGDVVVAGQEIGAAQDLSRRYPNITNHVHVEIDVGGVTLDPAMILPGGHPGAYAAIVPANANGG